MSTRPPRGKASAGTKTDTSTEWVSRDLDGTRIQFPKELQSSGFINSLYEGATRMFGGTPGGDEATKELADIIEAAGIKPGYFDPTRMSTLPSPFTTPVGDKPMLGREDIGLGGAKPKQTPATAAAFNKKIFGGTANVEPDPGIIKIITQEVPAEEVSVVEKMIKDMNKVLKKRGLPSIYSILRQLFGRPQPGGLRDIRETPSAKPPVAQFGGDNHFLQGEDRTWPSRAVFRVNKNYYGNDMPNATYPHIGF